MTYISSNIIQAGTLEDYDEVLRALPTTEPEGLLGRYAGTHGGSLVVTTVWSSKADCDRFSADVLGPTIARAQPDGTGVETIDYECHDVFVADTSTAGA